MPRLAALTTIHLPLDETQDRDFWRLWDRGPQFGTPLYYGPHLERFPERSAAVVAALVDAHPGGVAFHCGGGRDHAGQIAMLLLALVGVPAECVAADYELSAPRLSAHYTAHGVEDQGPVLKALLDARGTTAPAVIVDLLASLDVHAHLRAGGLTGEQIAGVRARLVTA